MLVVAGILIGSGLLITLLETNLSSKSLQQSAIVQGEHLCHALVLKDTGGTLTNDLVSLRKLLNHQQLIIPSIAYIFIIRKDQVLAHTFSTAFR